MHHTKKKYMQNTISQETKDILIAHNLDFEIKKVPLFEIKKVPLLALVGGEHISTDYYGLVNSKTGHPINCVKEGYTVSQNEDIVEMVLRGIKPFGDALRVTKAGSLNDGRKVYLQLGIEGSSKVGDDTIERFVTIIDSNDGSTGLSIGIGDLTLSCQNQFYCFYKRGDAKFRHTATIEQKIKTIPSLIETALSVSMRQIERYTKFVSTPVSKRLADEMVKYLIGFDREITSMNVLSEKSTRSINKLDAIYDSIEKEMNQKGENMWGLVSGITRYTTHELKTPKRDNSRIESLLTGTAYNMNQSAMKFASEKLQLELA